MLGEMELPCLILLDLTMPVMDGVEFRMRQLADPVLATMPGVTLHTPLDAALAGGIVCFEVAGLRPAEVAHRLRGRGIVATESPYAVSYARVAAGIMVQPEEIETTLREIRALAKAA